MSYKVEHCDMCCPKCQSRVEKHVFRNSHQYLCTNMKCDFYQIDMKMEDKDACSVCPEQVPIKPVSTRD
jgi:hypothetical protein